MRLAIISDIHGNALALDAVLADLASASPDAVVCLGDMVSGPLDPAGTAERLIALGCTSVGGNHDRWLVAPEGAGPDPVDRFARERLSDDQFAWLSALPATTVVDGDVFVCHGTPRSDVETWLDNPFRDRVATLPDSDEVARHAEGLDFSLFLCGHTHVARSVRLRDGRMVVNPGAVGLQFFHGSPDARYALAERRNGSWAVGLRSVPYDHEAAARQAEANGFGVWRDVLVYGWDGPEGLF